MIDLFQTSSAVISDCGRYRYRLERRWGDGKPLTFIMLNPSTADADQDDATIRRCIGFAKREGAGALVVVNLFAFRATRPVDLYVAADPVGPETDRRLVDAINDAGGQIIAAWGADMFAVPRAAYIMADLVQGTEFYCLGVTKDGSPRHPLYLKADTPLVRWDGCQP